MGGRSRTVRKSSRREVKESSDNKDDAFDETADADHSFLDTGLFLVCSFIFNSRCFKKTKTSLKGNSCEDEIGVRGRCRARIPSFTFNYKLGKCQEFNYGGCGGSNNRFKTKEDCESECGEIHTTLGYVY